MPTNPESASFLLQATMALIAVFVAVMFVAGVSRAKGPATIAAIGITVSMAIQLLLASQGILRMWERRPPPFMLMIVLVTGLTIITAFSKVGSALSANLSFPALILAQGFRFPLELVMHHAANENVMPVQMTYTGRNFDILTGITAIVVGWLVWKGVASRAVIFLWNLMGLALLINVVLIAITSMPMIAVFGPNQLNTWVAYPPFVWLPGVMVQAALLGHILIFRKLRS